LLPQAEEALRSADEVLVNSVVSKKSNTFPWYGILGLLIIAVGEVLLVLRSWVVPQFLTPIAWTGYILFVDGLNLRIRGESLIRSRPREFLLMLPWSVSCWLVFELYNLHLESWMYSGLPQNLPTRVLGYVWSFATIFPAILETADLFQPAFQKVVMKPVFVSDKVLYFLIVIGGLCLIIPLLFSHSTAGYFIGFVWLGFAFLLEPVNHLRGGRSLFVFFERGELKQVLSLLVAGLVCGILWEFWNYWAEARWVYKLPFSWAGPKIFEMPLLGYLGFLPFAVECHSMQNYLMTSLQRTKLLAIPSTQ
jgi:hypothetical protein